jgi:guanylate kinase
LKAALPGDVVGVFIKPPSLAALRERLVSRGDAPEEITRRMDRAEAETAHAGEFDFVVENADFDKALGALRGILEESRLARRMG